jgi:expansin (peptidoglycan-binding protein)
VIRPLLPAAVAAGLVLLVVPACGGDDASGDGSSGSGSGGTSTVLSSEQRQGIATFYDYSGSGQVACSYDIGSDTDVAAIDTAEYAKAAACGSCVDVSGPKGKVTVKIVDLCPGCEKNHLDLSAQAFAKIADPVDGRISITYQLVACNVKGKMSYHFKDGSSKYWTAIQILDHRVPIAKVEYKKNGAYTEMPRVDYNYFVDQHGVGDQPNGISLRITATDGQSVEDKVPGVEQNKTFPGSVQFK